MGGAPAPGTTDVLGGLASIIATHCPDAVCVVQAPTWQTKHHRSYFPVPLPLPRPVPLQVCFSPDGRYVLSASFDKSIKLWDGIKGTFMATFRGHVGPVYQVAWSSDSRMFVSGSKDSMLKVCVYAFHNFI